MKFLHEQREPAAAPVRLAGDAEEASPYAVLRNRDFLLYLNWALCRFLWPADAHSGGRLGII